MRKEILNGIPVPYDLPFDELEAMLLSDDMKKFCLACEVLSHRNDKESYHAIKAFLSHHDKYRRLYAMKTIFRNSNSTELLYVLENALSSDDTLFVNAALEIIAENEIHISDVRLFSSIKKHFSKIDVSALYCLKNIDSNNENFNCLLDLFNKSSQSSQKELLGQVLMDKYLPEKAESLFRLFSISEYPRVRIFAVKIGNEFGYDISAFSSDYDGHVRNLAKKYSETR